MRLHKTKIFVCYRREDAAHQAGRLFDHLVVRFGKGNVFKDVDSMPLGEDFRRVLGERVGECDVLLALVGDNWLTIAHPAGGRRLDDPTDFVRIEIETALGRDIPVIPLLVGQAPVPPAESLPPSLQGLAYRHGMPIRPDPDFRRDIERLVAGLSGMSPRPAPKKPDPRPREPDPPPRKPNPPPKEPDPVARPQRAAGQPRAVGRALGAAFLSLAPLLVMARLIYAAEAARIYFVCWVILLAVFLVEIPLTAFLWERRIPARSLAHRTRSVITVATITAISALLGVFFGFAADQFEAWQKGRSMNGYVVIIVSLIAAAAGLVGGIAVAIARWLPPATRRGSDRLKHPDQDSNPELLVRSEG